MSKNPTSNSNKCTSCSASTGFPYLDTNSKMCVTSCSSGKYSNDATYLCETCDSSCKECIFPGTSSACTYCFNGFYLSLGACIPDCLVVGNFSNP